MTRPHDCVPMKLLGKFQGSWAAAQSLDNGFRCKRITEAWALPAGDLRPWIPAHEPRFALAFPPKHWRDPELRESLACWYRCPATRSTDGIRHRSRHAPSFVHPWHEISPTGYGPAGYAIYW